MLSPDGRFIAADASTYVRSFLTEGPFCVKAGGFVLIDVETGKPIYEYHHRMRGFDSDATALAFSQDGRLLFVDPNHGGCGGGTRIDIWVSGNETTWRPGRTEHESGEQVDVYSLEGLR